MSKHVTVQEVNERGHVQLSSGWFTPGQSERYDFVENALKEIGFNIYSPQVEAVVSPNADEAERHKIFLGDLEAIRNCVFMVNITNEKDMGTIFEAGYAYHNNIPIVYFAEGLNGPFNLMLAQSGAHVITSREQLIEDLSNPEILGRIVAGDRIPYTGKVE